MKPKPSEAMTTKRKKGKISEMRRLFRKIFFQAIRKNIGCDSKYYLRVDLEIIAQSAQAGLDLCGKARPKKEVA